MEGWVGLVATILTSLGGASLVSLLLVRTQRRKISADANLVSSQAEVALSTEARQWLLDANRRAERAEARTEALEIRIRGMEDEAERRGSRLEARIRQQDTHIAQLEKVLREAGMTIPPPPPMPEWLPYVGPGDGS